MCVHSMWCTHIQPAVCDSSSSVYEMQQFVLTPFSAMWQKAAGLLLKYQSFKVMYLGSTGVCLYWFSKYVRQQHSSEELCRELKCCTERRWCDLSSQFTCIPCWTQSCLFRLPRKPVGGLPHRRDLFCGWCSAPEPTVHILPYFIIGQCLLSTHPRSFSLGFFGGDVEGGREKIM